MGPRRELAVVALLLLFACSRSTPTAPVPPGRVRLVDGVTGAPVAGALVSGGDETVPTDGAGEAMLPGAREIAVEADGYLRRDTVRRDADETLTLWPAGGPAQIDESFTSTLVYADAGCPVDAPRPASSVLRRLPAGARLQVVVPSGLGAAALQAHAAAAEQLAYAASGAIAVGAGPEATGSVNVTVSVDPGNATCRGDEARGVTYLDESKGGEVRGARIVYCTAGAATRPELAAHELGHVAGLRHSAAIRDLMHCSIAAGVSAFTPRESAVLRLMYQRRAGTRFPDDDRGAASAASTATSRVTVSCSGPGA